MFHRCTVDPRCLITRIFAPVAAFWRHVVSFRFYILILAVFVTISSWSKSRDPFRRVYFSFKTVGGKKSSAIAVLPKTGRRFPVVVFVGDSDTTLIGNGNSLRTFAEFGFCAVAFEYDKSSLSNFDIQFELILEFLQKQSWAGSDSVWVGEGIGAQRICQFSQKKSHFMPKLMVQIAPNLTSSELLLEQESPLLNTGQPKFLVICGESPGGTEYQEFYANSLKKTGMPVEVRILPSPLSHIEDMPVVIRGTAEYCARFLGLSPGGAINVRPLNWQYWLPIVALVISLLVRAVMRWEQKTRSVRRGTLSRAVFIVAVLLACSSVSITSAWVILSRLTTDHEHEAFMKNFFIEPYCRDDFDWLTGRFPFTRCALDNVRLANYNRTLVGWNVADNIYQEFVLNPQVSTEKEQFNWRRPLWEYFYPRVRHMTNPVDAAQIVVRSLRARVTIVDNPLNYPGIESIWLRGSTDAVGFERIYVAALRSVGIPSKIGQNGEAAIFMEQQWQVAPRPIFSNF